MSEFDILGNNPAEPVPDVATAAEPGQPIEPETVESTLLDPRQGTSAPENEENVLESLTHRTVLSVKFAEDAENLQIESKLEESENLEDDDSQEIQKALSFYQTPNQTSISFLESLTNKEPIEKKYLNKFTQTFFKFMKNLSDRRFVEIVNQEVDYEDKSLVFYCTSSKLLLTFES